MKEYKIIYGNDAREVEAGMNGEVRYGFAFESMATLMTPNGIVTTVIMSKETK